MQSMGSRQSQFARPTPGVEHRIVLDDASGAESKERHQFEAKLIPGTTAGSNKTDRSLISVDDHRYDIIADVRICAEDLLVGAGNIRAGARFAEIRRHQARVRRVECLQRGDIVSVEGLKELIDETSWGGRDR
jgi:hypothetical protein